MAKIKRYITTTNLSGFSMMELILTIVILGIFATVAMTRTRSGLSTIREQIAIDQITSDIDLARSMAFGKHETITIEYSPNDESYAIYSGVGQDKEPITDFPNSEQGVISLDNSNMRDVNLVSASFLNNSENLQFLPFGDPVSGGQININEKTIYIEPVTGKWTVD